MFGYVVINLGVGYVVEKFDVMLLLKNLLDCCYFIFVYSVVNDYNMFGELCSLLVSMCYWFWWLSGCIGFCLFVDKSWYGGK